MCVARTCVHMIIEPYLNITALFRYTRWQLGICLCSVFTLAVLTVTVTVTNGSIEMSKSGISHGNTSPIAMNTVCRLDQ